MVVAVKNPHVYSRTSNIENPRGTAKQTTESSGLKGPATADFPHDLKTILWQFLREEGARIEATTDLKGTTMGAISDARYARGDSQGD
jgi:hypothetical protein